MSDTEMTGLKRQVDGAYPSLIDLFRQSHTKIGTFAVGGLAQQQYEQMLALKEAQINVPNQLTEEQIIEQMLGTRRGHNRGRGQVVLRANSSSIILVERSRPIEERSYTQVEVDELVAKSSSRLETKLDALLRGLKDNNIEIEFSKEDDEDEGEDGDEG